MRFLSAIIGVWLADCAFAQVSLDGTLGRSGPLAGPTYQISEDLGQRRGPNLFHSFGEFNLRAGESATFSGPFGIQNVLARVTGGAVSSIDGAMRCEVPNANLFFLNPSGVVFGPNASVDVEGAFVVSTADYLRLGGGGDPCAFESCSDPPRPPPVSSESRTPPRERCPSWLATSAFRVGPCGPPEVRST